MKSGLLIGLIALSLSVSAFGKEPTGLKSDKQKFSYTVGFQIGQNLKRQNLDLDTKAFAASVCAVVVRPAALRTIALRRGRTACTTASSATATQSPTATSAPS